MFDVLQRELRLIGIDLLGRVEGGFGFIEPFNPVFVTFEDTDYPDGDAVAQQLDSSGACPEQRNLAQVGLTKQHGNSDSWAKQHALDTDTPISQQAPSMRPYGKKEE